MSIGQYTGAPTSGMTGIRKYLNDQGYQDNQIGYNNGTVSLNGKSFYNATPQADGSTYAPQSALQSALKSYQGNDRNTMMNNTLSNVNSAVNTTTPFQFKQQQQPFSFDANSDPAYQSQLALAKSNIQTGQNNTLANLAAHGQGNSSYAATAAQQVADKAYGNLSNQILPGLIQQAYQRYQDQNNNDYRNQSANYGVGQDQLKNQSALASQLNGFGQQDFNNNLATNQDTRAQQAQDANFTGTYNNTNTSAIQKAMQDNSAKYAAASPAEQQRLHDENVRLAASIGGTDTTGNGDYTFNPIQRTLAAQNQDFNQQLDLGNQKITQQNADTQRGAEEAMAKYREAEAQRQTALASGQLGLGRQSNSIAQQRLNQEDSAKNIESDVYGHAQDFQSKQDVNDYFNVNGAYLTKQLGAKATNDLKNQFLASYNQDNKQSTSTYDRAFATAQRDGDWMSLSPDEKNARIKQYQDMLTNQ